MRASESPQGTVPSSLMVTSYRPDIVIHNVINNTVALLELTCPLDSAQHLEAARDRKQSKWEYLQILSELGRLGIFSLYDTIELSVLGHYLPSTLSSLHKTVHQSVSKLSCRKVLDKAAGFSISASQRIFLARERLEWTHI